MLNPGTVVLAQVQFTNMSDLKIRPALVLFEEFDNIIVAGITSNTNMAGVALTKKKSAIKESIIKLNYILTISKTMVLKHPFALKSKKKKIVFSELVKKLDGLNN